MNLAKQILVVLSRVAPRGLTEPTLRDELSTRLGTRPGQMDTQDTLHRLHAQGYVAHDTDELTDDVRWHITEEGKKK